MDEEKNKKIEEKYRKRKKHVLILFIVFLLLSFVLLYYVGIEEKKKEAYPYINIVEREVGEKQEGNAGEAPFVQVNPLDIIPRDRVLMIVQNPDYSVPPEFKFSKGEVVLQYISECRDLTVLEEEVNCLDVYFVNNIPHLKPMRESCTEGNISCLDEYYLEASMYGERAYCDMISSESLKGECNAGK